MWSYAVMQMFLAIKSRNNLFVFIMVKLHTTNPQSRLTGNLGGIYSMAFGIWDVLFIYFTSSEEHESILFVGMRGGDWRLNT